jgi:hypothetical protein
MDSRFRGNDDVARQAEEEEPLTVIPGHAEGVNPESRGGILKS